jgi:cell division protein FtsB
MRWFAGVLLLVLLALQCRLWVGDGSFSDVEVLREEIAARKTELEQLRSRNQILEAEVRDLRVGLDALEERARSELGMIKQGEMFLQVIEHRGGSTQGAPIFSAPGEPPGGAGARTALPGRQGDGLAGPKAAHGADGGH